MDYKGKVCLITGGTKGLGFATSLLMASNGADVYMGYRSDDGAAEISLRKIEEFGNKTGVIKADLSEDGGIESLFKALEKKTSKLDFYVHNAAGTSFRSLLDIGAHNVDKTFNITVKSFILGVQLAVQMMGARGAIVSVSGMDTLKMVPGHGLLAAAKSSLETLTKYFSHELAPKNIRVNGVNPGFLPTDSTRKYLGSNFEKFREEFQNSNPLKREPRLEEVARVILFLCSEQASWVVGQNLIVDGGQDFQSNFKV